MLGPQGPLQHATRATSTQSSSKNVHEVGCHHGEYGDVLSHPRLSFHSKSFIPPRYSPVGVSMVERLLPLR
jgi:hypothetical protein